MNEIGSIDSVELYPSPTDEPSFFEQGKTIGRIAFIFSSCCAIAAATPALFKKRRLYSSMTPSSDVAPQAQELFEPEGPPLVAPRATPEEQAKVREIFETVATTSALGLGPWTEKYSRLQQLKREIKDMHPLAFLSGVPRDHIQTIFAQGGTLKIWGVVGGVQEGMEREIGKNNVERFIPSFAQVMNKAPQKIRLLIRARGWEGLVRYLFEIPGVHEE